MISVDGEQLVPMIWRRVLKSVQQNAPFSCTMLTESKNFMAWTSRSMRTTLVTWDNSDTRRLTTGDNDIHSCRSHVSACNKYTTADRQYLQPISNTVNFVSTPKTWLDHKENLWDN